MALEYDLYCSLTPEQLEKRITAFCDEALVGMAWTSAKALTMSELQHELRREQGFDGPFGSFAYIRLAKDDTVVETNLVKAFYETLPAPKVALFEGSPLLDGRLAPSPMPPEDRITEGWRSGRPIRKQEAL